MPAQLEVLPVSEPTVMVVPWHDPVVEAVGYDVHSTYVELFWLNVLGPTATWLLRRMARGLDRYPFGYELDLADTVARSVSVTCRGRPTRSCGRCTAACCSGSPSRTAAGWRCAGDSPRSPAATSCACRPACADPRRVGPPAARHRCCGASRAGPDLRRRDDGARRRAGGGRRQLLALGFAHPSSPSSPGWREAKRAAPAWTGRDRMGTWPRSTSAGSSRRKRRDFDRAVAEIRAGRKRSHWIWYVFPQIVGLGSSPTAVHYGITSIDEARAFLDHPVLGPTTGGSSRPSRDQVRRRCRWLDRLLGWPDDAKAVSSLTLFAGVAEPDDPLRRRSTRSSSSTVAHCARPRAAFLLGAG